ncbi:LigB-domain-containing protein [Clavulina sp. PMI_390]|nr:LigB-domain-containing protein [Clavulina sp. PMI_390]
MPVHPPRSTLLSIKSISLIVVAVLLALLSQRFLNLRASVTRTATAPSLANTKKNNAMAFSTDIASLKKQWREALDELPSTPDNIPAFFLAHGHPMTIWPKHVPKPEGRLGATFKWGGPDGPLGLFLDDFGPVLLEKYKPKGIVVFSAHWETNNQRLVSDYGDENPLLMDYYGFNPELYKLEFKSRGDKALTSRVVEAFTKAGMPARPSPSTEVRGRDGRPRVGSAPLPSGAVLGAGFDHGVFMPFMRMFRASQTKSSPASTLPPIVEVSIDSSLDPTYHLKIGQAVQDLRKEGVLVISGGLTVHTFQDFSAFSLETAGEEYTAWDKAVGDAVEVEDPTERTKALLSLTSHPGFRLAHPREDHFIPLYVAAGAGGVGSPQEKEGKLNLKAKVLSRIYGGSSFVFGLE